MNFVADSQHYLGHHGSGPGDFVSADEALHNGSADWHGYVMCVTHKPGVSFTWGSMLGWSAVAGSCYWPAVAPLYASTITWGVAYDLIYAHQDKVDDRATGVGSMALLFGDDGTKPALTAFTVLWLALLAYAVNETGDIFPAWTREDGQKLDVQAWVSDLFTTGRPFFVLSWLGALAHATWQVRTVDLNNRADCWAKFCSNRTLGLIVFSGLAADYLNQWSRQPKIVGTVVTSS